MNGKLIIPVVLMATMIVTGFIVSRSGKPYNSLLLTLHKFISLGTVIYLVMTVIQIHRVAPLSAAGLTGIFFSAVMFVALFATGGVISAMKTPPHTIQLIHHILPYLLSASTLATLIYV